MGAQRGRLKTRVKIDGWENKRYIDGWDIFFRFYERKKYVHVSENWFMKENICCWYSKESSQWEGSFEHPGKVLKILIGDFFKGALTRDGKLTWESTHA